ncbi:unnamed protein product [Protopolystoma xenopodis]|uniref:Uncharacterized protein n=1 Tax=Protopolystoma xenopodis TaxID=117903 RepID=A0A3S5AGS2_9PLAT|nr:unnamed protein product [Protopolystoma xenopodis]
MPNKLLSEFEKGGFDVSEFEAWRARQREQSDRAALLRAAEARLGVELSHVSAASAPGKVAGQKRLIVEELHAQAELRAKKAAENEAETRELAAKRVASIKVDREGAKEAREQVTRTRRRIGQLYLVEN